MMKFVLLVVNSALIFQDQHGKRLSAEVAIMLAFSAETDESLGISIPVTLLDWYDVRYELILVLQRPVPCEDLFMYCRKKGGYLEEKEAKVSRNNVYVFTPI